MKAKEFVLEIKAIAPSVIDYISRGYSEKLASRVAQSFLINEKKQETKFEDELLRLIDCLDVNNLEIGIVKFHKNIQVKFDYYIVGEVEADWLIIDKITGLVRVIELYSEKSLWSCATNGSKFLDAILEVKKFIAKTSLDSSWTDEQKILCSFSEECGNMAGGEKFIEFYKMLIGCYEW